MTAPSRPLARSLCRIMVLHSLLVALVGITFSSATRAAPTVIYVTPDGTGDGASWASAAGLQDALTPGGRVTAGNGDEIRAAAGTYLPGDSPGATFQLVSGVALYGGFAGNESSREQRDWEKNTTILSGDLNGDDQDTDGDGVPDTNIADNAYHVVSASALHETTILDGFTISGGHASGSAGDADGAGLTLAGTTLYDGSSGVTPDQAAAAPDGPWFSFATLNLNDFSTVATQTADGSVTRLDSTTNDDNRIYGGYNNHTLAGTLVNPNFPRLDRSQGYVLSFTANLIAESHTSSSRAGFSVIAISHDVGAGVPSSIELGFQDGRIFAQDEGFTAAEATTNFNPLTAGPVAYDLELYQDGYELRADGTTILSGTLRDYTAFSGAIDPYETPDFIFLGDDTTSARAVVAISSVQLHLRATLHLAHLNIVHNRAGNRGGGMASSYSSPRLTNVTFAGNQASSGGGMASRAGNPQLTNVTFAGNRASSGGGMVNSTSHPVLTNVTLAANRATSGGGVANQDNSSPLFQNSILWGNAADSGDQITSDSGTPTFTYSLVQGSGGSGAGWDATLGSDGGNNLDSDPAFVAPEPAGNAPTSSGDYRLQSSSPAIDAGNNDLVPEGVTTDRDGRPRRVDGNDDGIATVDPGAYEFTTATEPPTSDAHRLYLPLIEGA